MLQATEKKISSRLSNHRENSPRNIITIQVSQL